MFFDKNAPLMCYKENIGEVVRTAINVEKKSTFHTLGQCFINTNPIPKITHHIWITNKNREVSEKNFAGLLKQYDNLINKNFKHFFWVNDEELIPETIKKLEGLPEVEIKNIKELESETSLIPVVQACLAKGIYGVAVDALKYELLKLFGGVALDLNYSLEVDNFDDLLNSYSFFITGLIDGRKTAYENSIIGAAPEHPILNEVSNSIHQYFEHKEINASWENVMHTQNCYMLLTQSVNDNFWPDNNSDMYEEVFNRPCGISKIIGSDGYEGSWQS